MTAKKGQPQENPNQPSPWTEAAASLWQQSNENYFVAISEVMNGPVTQTFQTLEAKCDVEDLLPDLQIS